MSASEEAAFKEVALYCEQDVRTSCDDARVDPMMESMMMRFMQQQQPLHISELEHEIESFIESVLHSALQMPTQQMQRTQQHSLVLIVGNDHQQQEVKQVDENQDEFDPFLLPLSTTSVLLDAVAGHVPPHKLPCAAKHMRVQAKAMLLEASAPADAPAQDAPHVLAARRLSEVTAADLQERQQGLLPYGPAVNTCLRTRYARAQLSQPCGRALYRLDQVRTAQYVNQVQWQRENAVVLVHLLCLYGLVLLTGAVLYWRRRHAVRRKRRLQRLLFQTVYSSPELKAAVEKRMGESAGRVPPLPTAALVRMGRFCREFRALWRCCWTVRVVVGTVMCVAFCWWPLATLPVVVGYAAAVFWTAACSPAPHDMCVCCCCGSTTDMQAADRTAAQECCACCAGTGVCGTTCASCCGNVQDEPERGASGGGCCDGCCCCGDDEDEDIERGVGGCCDDCCCCGDEDKKNLKDGCCEDCCCCGESDAKAKSNVKDGCCDNCCCCGSDAKADLMNGCCDDCCCCGSNNNMTKSTVKGGCCDDCCCCGDDKMMAGDGCCNDCCRCGDGDNTKAKTFLKDGHGCCDDCCCCGDGDDTKAKTLHPRMIVYEGVPVQIV